MKITYEVQVEVERQGVNDLYEYRDIIAQRLLNGDVTLKPVYVKSVRVED